MFSLPLRSGRSLVSSCDVTARNFESSQITESTFYYRFTRAEGISFAFQNATFHPRKYAAIRSNWHAVSARSDNTEYFSRRCLTEALELPSPVTSVGRKISGISFSLSPMLLQLPRPRRQQSSTDLGRGSKLMLIPRNESHEPND